MRCVVHLWEQTTYSYVLCTISTIQSSKNFTFKSRGNQVIMSHRYLQQSHVLVATICNSLGSQSDHLLMRSRLVE